MAKQIVYAENSRQDILRGVNQPEDAGKVTIDSKERKGVLEKRFRGPNITIDGVMLFYVIERRAPRSTLFPYTTLFRSRSPQYVASLLYLALFGSVLAFEQRQEIGRAHVSTPVTRSSRMPSSARKKKTEETKKLWQNRLFTQRILGRTFFAASTSRRMPGK